MQTNIRKIGNSLGVIIGKKLLEKAGIKGDTPVDIQVKDGAIVIKPVSNRSPINRDISSWRKQFKKAFAAGENPEKTLIADDENEWGD